jgi:hypothetical protein
MRKVEQRKILELLKTLSEANSEMKRLFLRRKISSVKQVLSDCQDCAIAIGTYIEEIAGEGTKTIVLLEEYCEELYNVSVLIDNGSAAPNFKKRLDRCLMRIEDSIRAELLPDKIEMVFLCYKASMWDSLESIYLAAKDDPSCDAYVISIPYYDRLPGGIFAQMHCESDEYPENIPMTNWREYDVEERHPDVIFIMNPYDDDNYVTSVHPMYYSSRLKDCCDYLFYVPYFVCSGVTLEPGFCVATAVMNSTKIVVQSEAIKNAYIKNVREIVKSNKNRGYFEKLEDKILALGSPKFDATINAKPDSLTIPDKWGKLVYYA